jgi:hypothetical protein
VLSYAIVRTPVVGAVVATVGALGGVFLALVLVRRADELLPAALVCLTVAYMAAVLVHGRGVDEASPLVAVGLLLCGELAVWSLDERHAIQAERRVFVARAVAVAALAATGLAAGAVVLALAAAPVGDGLAWTTAGAAAAVGILTVVTRLVRREG